MPDLLTVTISDKALFDFTKLDAIAKKGNSAFESFLNRTRNKPLSEGPGLRLIHQLSNIKDETGRSLVNCVLLSTMDPQNADRLFNSLTHYGLQIGSISFTSACPISQATAYGADLFLHHDEASVKNALTKGVPSAYLHGGSYSKREGCDKAHFILDGDCVLFSDESERAFTSCPINGLANFFKYEAENNDKIMEAGPMAGLLKKLNILRSATPTPQIKLTLVTARTFPTHNRPLITLKHWGIKLDEYHFMAGRSKSEVIRNLKGDIFFDDQSKHCVSAALHTPSGQVFNVTTTHAGT